MYNIFITYLKYMHEKNYGITSSKRQIRKKPTK